MLNLTPTVRNLLLANVALFLIQAFTPVGTMLTQLGSLFPLNSPFFYPWQFLTCMFLHANLGHLFGNMFGLFSFGPMLEQRWGGRRFLTFWLVCGLGASVLYEGVRTYELRQMQQDAIEFHQLPGATEFKLFYDKHFPDADETQVQAMVDVLRNNPGNATTTARAQQTIDATAADITNSPSNYMLGASGALFGVLFAFAYLFPNTMLMLIYFPVPIKAKYFVLLYGAYELFAGVHRIPGDNVAHFAHLGGLLVGFILIKIWERGRTQFY